MKAITLINPRGERLELTNVEFYELQLQFANSKTFEQWSEKRRISGWIGKGDDIRLSISAVNKFLREKGYQIIDNLPDSCLSSVPRNRNFRNGNRGRG